MQTPSPFSKAPQSLDAVDVLCARTPYDGAKRRKGNRAHLAVDTLGHLLALCVGPANEDDRTRVGELAELVQLEMGESVEIADVDQGYTGARATEAAAAQGIKLEVVKLPNAVLSYCPSGGWWHAALGGWHVSGA